MSTVLALLLSVPAAPLPPPRQLTRASVVGRWTVWWGGAPYDTEFRPNGDYRATWSGVLCFVGSWDVDSRGRLLITEMTAPGDPNPDYWQHFIIRMNPATGLGQTLPAPSSEEPYLLGGHYPIRMKRMLPAKP